MAKIVDINGKSWSLASRTDSMGRVYARAYRNAWDPVKRRSFVEARIQIGRVQNDNRINLSENFKKQFPAFAEGEWRWGNKELLPPEQYSALYDEPEAKDVSWSNDTIRFGLTWAGWEFLRHNRILADLEDVFGVRDARLIAALALYKLDGYDAMTTFEDWVPQVWLPSVTPVPGQRISELLERINDVKVDEYYRRRYQRCLSGSANGHTTLSFDSTSIGTYSKTIKNAAYGHAKQNPELPQINYMAVCDHATGDIVYACTYEGSINDKTILPNIYTRMSNAGISLANNILVTDRGFQSIHNTQTQINLELKYIQFLSVTEDAVKQRIRRRAANLADPLANRDPCLGLTAVTDREPWSQSVPGIGTLTVNGYLHLYKDPELATKQTDETHRKVLELLDLKNETGNPRSSYVDPEIWRKFGRFLTEKQNPANGENRWAVNYDALRKATEFNGFQAIRSNVIADPIEAMKIYRQRNIIEQGFQQLKNEVGGDRLQATETTYRGKIFLYSIAQAVRMSMLQTAKSVSAKNPELKLPDDSLRKLLVQLNSLQARLHRSTSVFVVGSVPKKYRNLMELLGIKKLPQKLER